MEHFDARALLQQALLRGRHNAKKAGGTVAFRCPRHDDRTNSAWLGDHQWGCAACGFTEHFDTLADLLGVDLPEQVQRGLTVAAYAEKKGLSLSTLQRAGVHEQVGKFGDALVAIPYRDADGHVLRTKLRGPKGSWWAKDGEGTPLYGLDVLASRPGEPVLLVEGESDCHAGWERGVLVVGVPGATLFKAEHAEALQGRSVVVWQEPDEAGATFVQRLAAWFPKAKVLTAVQHHGEPVKDLCDLHQRVAQSGESWRDVWPSIIRTAFPIGSQPPVVAFDTIAGDTLEQMLDEKLAPIDAVPTMLPTWNMLCGGGGGGVGLARSWLVTLGALTGTGKTLFALNLATEAIRQGERVCFISLEMGRSELATRMLAIVSGESVTSLEQGRGFDPAAFKRAGSVMNQIQRDTGGMMLINRRPVSRLADVMSVFKYYAEYEGVRYFVIDYAQLVYTSGNASIHERVEAVMHAIREATLTLRTVTIVLSQFNRQVSAQRDERPVSQGLAGSSAIENDSHQILLFDHSRFVREGRTAKTWLIVDKNRHGPVADLPVLWDYNTLRLIPRAPTLDEQEEEHGHLSKKKWR